MALETKVYPHSSPCDEAEHVPRAAATLLNFADHVQQLPQVVKRTSQEGDQGHPMDEFLAATVMPEAVAAQLSMSSKQLRIVLG